MGSDGQKPWVVTQADREAAAKLKPYAGETVIGLHDGGGVVQAFAKHRHEAQAELVGALTEVLSALAWMNDQAENAMATSAGCATTHGDDGGGLQMLNSIASDIGINCSMQSDKITALLAKLDQPS
jgi:hypothetical protein